MSIPSSDASTSSPVAEQASTTTVNSAAAASTTNQAPAPQQQPTKRSSRRANTAERRATHNAVERARRETLNGRFLDLAALLPNLAAVRRPSKSAIVNSSIALIHNQRRSRIIAARELRLIKTENDALRQELNEWRQRNSLPRVEEPPRSSDLIALLNLEEELEDNEMINRRAFDLADGPFEDDEYNDEDGDEQLSPESAHPYAPGAAMGLNIAVPQKSLPVNTLQQQQMQLAAHQQQQQQQQQQALFEQQKAAMARSQMVNAGARYAQQAPIMPQQQFMFNENLFPTDMYTTDNTNAMYGGAQTWSQKAIAAATNALHTPPGSAHGVKPSPFANTANSAFLSNYNGQHGMNMFKQGFMNGNAGSEDGDNSSVGEGSSHFSGSEMGNIMGTSPVEHAFAYNMGGMGVGLGMQVPLNMSIPMPLNMTMPPSPPHSLSPDHSNPQSRRASVNISHGYGSNKSSPSPVPHPVQAQFANVGLVM